MADTTTTNYGLVKPELKSTGWGEKINTDLDTIDTQMNINKNVANAAVPKTTTVNGKALSGDITLTTVDIADSTDKRYVTDAQKTVIGNTSGTNTGDQTLPVKATGTEADTGTDDVKFLTAKAAKDSHNIPSVAPGTAGNILTSDGTDWTSAEPSASGASAVELSFDNDDLSTGVLTVTHNGGLSAGYTAIVQVINNSGAMVIPDKINTFAANSFKVDLTSFGTIIGTWYCTYIVKG